jgi:hypothetical protein
VYGRLHGSGSWLGVQVELQFLLMLRDVLPLYRLLAAWAAAGEACAIRTTGLFLSLFGASSAIPLLVSGLHRFALDLFHVAAPGVEPIRRAAHKLADSIQPRAPPFAV